jgi:hypothetical protein
MTRVPVLFKGLLDDAEVFPPGRAPLPEAVPAHARQLASPYADLVGPLILPAPALADLGPLLGTAPERPLDLAVTAPEGAAQLGDVLAKPAELPVRLQGLEVALPAGMSSAAFFTALEPVFVEVPRDERRAEVIATCATTGHQAKFRTGGLQAAMYPGEAELAAAIRAVVEAGVPFKATAGLHRAIRNTDPETGFEQHGFLNLLLATAAALEGPPGAELTTVLATRNGTEVAARVSDLDGSVRERLRSLGTCSIIEPLTGLVDLDLVPATVLTGDGVSA